MGPTNKSAARESDAGDRRPADVDPMFGLFLISFHYFISTFCIRTFSLILMFYVREATGYFKDAGEPNAHDEIAVCRLHSQCTILTR